MLPTPLVSQFAWQQIVRELDRVAPAEGLLVPLVALRGRHREANPCALVELDSIAEVIIAAVLLVPNNRQVNRLTRVRVLPQTDALMGERIEAMVKRYPRLRACAHLHSHPFAVGRTAPSHGASGDIDGHLLPLWRANRGAGLNTSFSFIACRDLEGRGWRLQCFAVDQRGEIVDLGFTRVVANDSAAVGLALQRSLDRHPTARALLRHWRRGQRRCGRRVRTDELFDGWKRLTARDRRGSTLVLLVPPGFPAEPPRRYLVQPGTAPRSCRRLAGPWHSTGTEVDDEPS